MPPAAPLPHQGCAARDNRAQAPALLRLLLALLAALLGGGRRRAAWHPLPSWDDPDAAIRVPADSHPDSARLSAAAGILRVLRRHWHADSESPILYVIGPGPNRGMRPRPRATPQARPEFARAPPPRAAPAA
jgi:hypothetical protein